MGAVESRGNARMAPTTNARVEMARYRRKVSRWRSHIGVEDEGRAPGDGQLKRDEWHTDDQRCAPTACYDDLSTRPAGVRRAARAGRQAPPASLHNLSAADEEAVRQASPAAWMARCESPTLVLRPR